MSAQSKLSKTTARRARKKYAIGKSDIEPGGRRLVEVGGKSIGIFNVDGRYYALHNRCPHMAGSLCEGPVCGTSMPSDDFVFNYGRENEILRCGWHGWEFDITSGECLVDAKMRARRYQVSVEGEQLYLHI